MRGLGFRVPRSGLRPLQHRAAVRGGPMFRLGCRDIDGPMELQKLANLAKNGGFYSWENIGQSFMNGGFYWRSHLLGLGGELMIIVSTRFEKHNVTIPRC